MTPRVTTIGFSFCNKWASALIMDDREGGARCVSAHEQTCPLIQLQQLVGMYSALHVHEMVSLCQCIRCVLMSGGGDMKYTEVPPFTQKDLNPRHAEAGRLKTKGELK